MILDNNAKTWYNAPANQIKNWTCKCLEYRAQPKSFSNDLKCYYFNTKLVRNGVLSIAYVKDKKTLKKFNKSNNQSKNYPKYLVLAYYRP